MEIPNKCKVLLCLFTIIIKKFKKKKKKNGEEKKDIPAFVEKGS